MRGSKPKLAEFVQNPKNRPRWVSSRNGTNRTLSFCHFERPSLRDPFLPLVNGRYPASNLARLISPKCPLETDDIEIGLPDNSHSPMIEMWSKETFDTVISLLESERFRSVAHETLRI